MVVRSWWIPNSKFQIADILKLDFSIMFKTRAPVSQRDFDHDLLRTAPHRPPPLSGAIPRILLVGIWNPRCLPGSSSLESGIGNLESPVPSRILLVGIWNRESGIWNPRCLPGSSSLESGIWNPH